MAVSSILSRGIIGSFYHMLEESTRAAWATTLGMVQPSDQETETYPFLGHAPVLTPWIDARGAKMVDEDTQTVTNIEYQASIPVPRAWIRRDKTPQIRARINELGARAGSWWNSELSAFIDLGTGTTKGTGPYGGAFFQDSHAVGGGQTVDNLLTHAAATGVIPTTDEMVAAIFGTGISGFMNMVDNEGEPWHENPRSFLIMVPSATDSSLFQRAAEALNLTQTSGGGNNIITSIGGYDFQLVVNPRLTTDPSRMFMFRTDGQMAPFILQEEEAPVLESLEEGSDTAFKENRYLFGIRTTRGIGYGYPQSAITIDFT